MGHLLSQKLGVDRGEALAAFNPSPVLPLEAPNLNEKCTGGGRIGDGDDSQMHSRLQLSWPWVSSKAMFSTALCPPILAQHALRKVRPYAHLRVLESAIKANPPSPAHFFLIARKSRATALGGVHLGSLGSSA